MREHIPAFEQHLASRVSIRTTTAYAAILAHFSGFLGDRPAPTRHQIEAFLARPRADGHPRSRGTRNHELAALRAFARFAQRDLGWSHDPTEAVPFLREARKDPPVLSMPELRALFRTTQSLTTTFARSQACAVLALLSQAGLRVHELVALDADQIDRASATLVAIRGKGGTLHDLPISDGTLALIDGWLESRAGVVLPGERALFVGRTGRRISVRTVQRLIVSLRLALGTAKAVTPHTLRHTAATLALVSGSDLSTVAELLRHANVNTTRRYLHLIDERRRDAVKKLAVAIPAELIWKHREGFGAGRSSSGNSLDALGHLYDRDEAA